MENIEFTTKNIDLRLLLCDFLKTNKDDVKQISENHFIYTDNEKKASIVKVETDLFRGESFLYNAEDYLEQNEMNYLVLIIEEKKEIYIFKKEKLLNWLKNNNESIFTKLNSINKEKVYERKYSIKEKEEIKEFEFEENKGLKFFNTSITSETLTHRKTIGKFPFVIEQKNNITVEKIETQLEKIEFDKFYNKFRNTPKNDLLENSKIPPIVYIYYFLYLNKNKIPTPEELVNFYINSFCKKKNENEYVLKYKMLPYLFFTYEEIAGRICRAYNSFNRELHTFAKLKEAGLPVEYSFVKDYKGIDLVINYEKEYEIRILQNSSRSNEYKERKDKYRHEYKNENSIILSMDKNNSHRIGDVYVFNNDIIENVVNQIKSNN